MPLRQQSEQTSVVASNVLQLLTVRHCEVSSEGGPVGLVAALTFGTCAGLDGFYAVLLHRLDTTSSLQARLLCSRGRACGVGRTSAAATSQRRKASTAEQGRADSLASDVRSILCRVLRESSARRTRLKTTEEEAARDS